MIREGKTFTASIDRDPSSVSKEASEKAISMCSESIFLTDILYRMTELPPFSLIFDRTNPVFGVPQLKDLTSPCAAHDKIMNPKINQQEKIISRELFLLSLGILSQTTEHFWGNNENQDFTYLFFEW